MGQLVRLGSRGHIREVDQDIFTIRFAPDCMAHACRCRDEGDRRLDDACCQHGADVDLFEKEAILARQTEIASILEPEARDPAGWFDDSEPEDDHHAYPSGTAVRSAVAGAGCVFLRHDARGCALHRAALAHGFAPEEIKPAVCRLYPLAYGDFTLWLSDDFERYSCAGDASGPTVYRLMRPVLASLFGRSLVRRLDQVERMLLARRLPLAARM
jgi:uncharacterized protein DUF3109